MQASRGFVSDSWAFLFSIADEPAPCGSFEKISAETAKKARLEKSRRKIMVVPLCMFLCYTEDDYNKLTKTIISN